jgi:hypothetical protein
MPASLQDRIDFSAAIATATTSKTKKSDTVSRVVVEEPVVIETCDT